MRLNILFQQSHHKLAAMNVLFYKRRVGRKIGSRFYSAINRMHCWYEFCLYNQTD